MITGSPVRLLASGLRAGSIDLVRRALCRHIVATVDSGGRYPVGSPVTGRTAVAALLVRSLDQCDVTVRERVVNDQPGIVLLHGRRVIAVMVTRSSSTHVREMWVVANPDKLASWNPYEQQTAP
jgi:hypothetical protein